MMSRQSGRFPGTEILPALILAVSPFFVGVYLLDNYRLHNERMVSEPVYRERVLREMDEESRELDELEKRFVEGYAAKHRIPYLDRLFSD